MSDSDYKPSIDSYLIKGETSWCREERQMALFLYNVLLGLKKGQSVGNEAIEKALIDVFGCKKLSDIEVTQVYYEAAILRDYFYYLSDDDKIDFNQKLLNFCFLQSEKESNTVTEGIRRLVERYCLVEKNGKVNKKGKSLTGAKEDLYKCADLCVNDEDENDKSREKPWPGCVLKNNEVIRKEDISLEDENEIKRLMIKQKIHFACMIMNAKPDIMVIYKEKNEKKALILECKYESEAGKYKDFAGVESIDQEFLQEMIMQFLFGKRDFGEVKSVLELYHGAFMDVTKISNRYREKKIEESYRKMWAKIYSFCDDIFSTPYQGLFNEEHNKEDEIIQNMGVCELKFERADTDDNEDSEGVRRIRINVRDIVDLMY
ncbi:MAG: hypothetical protein K6G81_12340 [Lachnospiraceae bacterium]|nr:hypothetical protein [Lachnospiraceae bacterium]